MENTRSRSGSIILPIVGIVVAVAIWWGATIAFNIRSFFLPSPADIYDSFKAQPEYLLKEALYTLEMTAIGFVIATVAGLLIAILLAASRKVEQATMPLFVGLNAIPKVAIAPLLLIWLGFDSKPKIVMVVLISFFPIIVASMAGLTSTPADLIDLSRSLTGSWVQTYMKIRLPFALPQIFVGLKVAVTLAVVGEVVAEIPNPNRGMGGVIVLSGSNTDTPQAFACIVLLAIMSMALYYLVSGLERLVLPWAKEIAG